jgi:cytochrome c biogenesis protein ResB
MGAEGPITELTPGGEARVDFAFNSSDNQPMDLLQLPAGEKIITLELTYYQDVARTEEENPPVYARAFVDKEFETPVYEGFIPRTGSFQVPGFEQFSFSFRKETTTVLEVAKDPGLLYVGIFFTIMTVAFGISLYTTFTRFWARITPSAERPGTLNITMGGMAEKNKVTFERDFERLATRVRDALAAESART